MALAASFDATAVAGTTTVQERIVLRFALAVLKPAGIPPNAHFQGANARGPNGGHFTATGRGTSGRHRWERFYGRLQD